MTFADVINTPERRQAALEEQELRRVRLGHRVLTDPAQIKYRWGVERVRSAETQLATVFGRPAVQTDNLYNQIAEGKAAQGLFEEAAAICKSAELKAEYEAKARAMINPNHGCTCPATINQVQPGNAKAIATRSRLPVEMLWDGERHLLLTRCVLCNSYLLQGRQN